MSGSHTRTRLQSLAVTWRVWCTLMLAFGRQVDVLQKMRADRALVQAEMLEAALYTGLIRLSAEIAAHNSQALEEEDATALDFLKTVHVLFSVLTLAIHQLKTDLAAEAERLRALRDGSDALTSQAFLALLCHLRASTTSYQDTS